MLEKVLLPDKHTDKEAIWPNRMLGKFMIILPKEEFLRDSGIG